jgi:5-oxoprolinase (ATP-hydrolysing) subunit A
MDQIDLNCDLGEGAGNDELLAPQVSSVNVACGFHAGGPETMRATVRLAVRHGLAVGAHPSFPDRSGFGRRFMAATPDEVRDDLTYQIGALWAFCRAEGTRLVHVKAHGALYNAAAGDPKLAQAIGEAVKAIDPALVVVALAGSPMVRVIRELGLRCAEEAFADRACFANGLLVPRSQPGAVLHDADQVAARVVMMAREKCVRTIDGTKVPMDPDTICVHGDTPGAVLAVAAIRARLKEEKIAVVPLA